MKKAWRAFRHWPKAAQVVSWVVVGFVVLMIIGLASGGGGKSKTGSQVAATSPITTPARTTTTPTTSQSSSGTSSSSAPSAGPTFGDGTHQVGTDIPAGTYRTNGQDGCYWERLRGTGGSFSDIIANDNATGPAIVTIARTDAAFKSQNCGTWSRLPTSGARAPTMGEGTYAVGIDILPGTYKTAGESACYWARLRGFGGSVASVIANDNTSGPAIVTIASTDRGFTSHGCGTWTRTR